MNVLQRAIIGRLRIRYLLNRAGVWLCMAYGATLYAQHKISFIIPCYNAPRLEYALASIYAQQINYPFEVICCDDGSTDDTLVRLLACKKKYPHMKVVKHVVNKGAGAAANSCVQRSDGDVIFRLDSDNMLAEPESNTINRLVELLDASGCDAAMVETMVLFEGDRNIKALWRYDAPDGICDLDHCIHVTHNPAMSGNMLMRRSAYERVGGYPEDHGSDTFRFGFKLYATGGKVALLRGAWYWHFYNPNGYWWREQKTGNNDKKALETVIEYKDFFTRTSQLFLLNALNTNGSLFSLIHQGKLALKNT